MVIVFNRAGGLVLLVAVMSWAGAQQLVPLNALRLVAGFGAMATLGGMLELQRRLHRARRPAEGATG